MIKTILVPLAGVASDKVALGTAFSVAKLFDSHIDALHVRVDPAAIALQTTGYDISVGISGMLTPEMMGLIRRNVAASAAAAHHTFNEFCEKSEVMIVTRPSNIGRVSASYREAEGEQSRLISVDARLRELTVIGRPDEYSDLSASGIGDVLIRSGRPLLLAANELQHALGRRIAIAWKETAEAARALTAAMPLLLKAERIVILSAVEAGHDADETVESAGRLADELSWHGIFAEVNCILPAPDLSGAVMDAALHFGADLLVMGGYGHSRAREFIFGGFTRRALRDAPVPIFLMH